MHIMLRRWFTTPNRRVD